MTCEPELIGRPEFENLKSYFEQKINNLGNDYATKTDVNDLNVELGFVRNKYGEFAAIAIIAQGAVWLLENVAMPAIRFLQNVTTDLVSEIADAKARQDELNKRWYLEQYEYEALKGAISGLQRITGEHENKINNLFVTQQDQSSKISNLLLGVNNLSAKASEQEALLNSTRFDLGQLGNFTNTLAVTTKEALTVHDTQIQRLYDFTETTTQKNAQQDAKDYELEQAVLALGVIFRESYSQILLSQERIIRDVAVEQETNRQQGEVLQNLANYSVNKNNEQDQRLNFLESLPRVNQPIDTTPQIDLSSEGEDLAIRVSVGNQSAQDRLNIFQIFNQYFQNIEQIIMPQFDTSELVRMLNDSRLREEVTLQNVLGIAAISGAILTQTSPTALRQAAAGGSCDTLNGGCGQNFRQQINNDNRNNLIPVNTALQGVELNMIQNVMNQGNRIFDAINEKFTKTWDFLKLDRVLNVLTTAAAVHNAAMLSRDLGLTLIGTISEMLAMVGLRDAEGNAFNFQSMIGSTVNGLVTQLVGADVVANISEAWRNANRIISSASSVIMSIRSVGWAIGEGVEIVGRYVSDIGNGLEDSGVVPERQWPWMKRDIDVNRASGIDNLNNRLASVVEITENVYGVAATGLEISQEISSLRSNVDTLKAETEGAIAQINNQRTQDNTDSASPTISNQDLIRVEADEVTP